MTRVDRIADWVFDRPGLIIAFMMIAAGLIVAFSGKSVLSKPAEAIEGRITVHIAPTSDPRVHTLTDGVECWIVLTYGGLAMSKARPELCALAEKIP